MENTKYDLLAVNNYLVIKPATEEQKMGNMAMTSSDTGHMRAKRAKILSVGENTAVKTGDEIFYDAARVFQVIVGGHTDPLTIIRINEVIAVIEPRLDENKQE